MLTGVTWAPDINHPLTKNYRAWWEAHFMGIVFLLEQKTANTDNISGALHATAWLALFCFGKEI